MTQDDERQTSWNVSREYTKKMEAFVAIYEMEASVIVYEMETFIAVYEMEAFVANYERNAFVAHSKKWYFQRIVKEQ